MEFHRNKATQRRPEGDRVLDAPYVLIDTASVQLDLRAERQIQHRDKNGFTVFKSDELAIVFVQLSKGARINPGRTNGTLIFQVVTGQLEISFGNEQSVSLSSQQMLVVHPRLDMEIISLQDTDFYLYNSLCK